MRLREYHDRATNLYEVSDTSESKIEDRSFSLRVLSKADVPQYQMTWRTPAVLKRAYSDGIVG